MAFFKTKAEIDICLDLNWKCKSESGHDLLTLIAVAGDLEFSEDIIIHSWLIYNYRVRLYYRAAFQVHEKKWWITLKVYLSHNMKSCNHTQLIMWSASAYFLNNSWAANIHVSTVTQLCCKKPGSSWLCSYAVAAWEVSAPLVFILHCKVNLNCIHINIYERGLFGLVRVFCKK